MAGLLGVPFPANILCFARHQCNRRLPEAAHGQTGPQAFDCIKCVHTRKMIEFEA